MLSSRVAQAAIQFPAPSVAASTYKSSPVSVVAEVFRGVGRLQETPLFKGNFVHHIVIVIPRTTYVRTGGFHVVSQIPAPSVITRDPLSVPTSSEAFACSFTGLVQVSPLSLERAYTIS